MPRFNQFPRLWILDEDPVLSAQGLCDRDVALTINSSYKLLINAYWQLSGIRSKRIYDFIRNNDSNEAEAIRERILSTTFQFFPINEGKIPLNPCNKTGEYKFTKQCLNHFRFVKIRFDALLNEYMFRFNKEHALYDASDWFDAFPPPNIKMIDLKKIQYPVRTIALKYRDPDIVVGMRKWYMRKVFDPINAYNRRSIPDWFKISENNALHFDPM